MSKPETFYEAAEDVKKKWKIFLCELIAVVVPRGGDKVFMTKKKIERLSVIHRREINWLKWYFLRDKKHPQRTILEQKIHEAFLQNDHEQSAFLVNLQVVTDEYIQNSEAEMLKTIKEVYVYESINVIGACQKILYLSPSPAYSYINKWFDNYFISTYKHIPLLK